jgi:hypothetical protein
MAWTRDVDHVQLIVDDVELARRDTGHLIALRLLADPSTSLVIATAYDRREAIVAARRVLYRLADELGRLSVAGG